MARTTIKSLEREVEILKGQVVYSQSLCRDHETTKRQVVERNEELKREVERLQKEIFWHRQLCQNLSEAICANMRNRR